MDEWDGWAEQRKILQRSIARQQNRSVLVAAVLTRRISVRTARKIWQTLEARPETMTVHVR